MKYKKKPVVIEAVKFVKVINGMIGLNEECGMPEWLFEAVKKPHYEAGSVWVDAGNQVRILTLEGTHLASQGDYIIQGIKGELYPCKPDIFQATYEPV